MKINIWIIINRTHGDLHETQRELGEIKCVIEILLVLNGWKKFIGEFPYILIMKALKMQREWHLEASNLSSPPWSLRENFGEEDLRVLRDIEFKGEKLGLVNE